MDTHDNESALLETIEAMPDGVVVFDAHRRLIACNTRLREIYAPAGWSFQPGDTVDDACRRIGRSCMGIETDAALEAWVAERAALATDGSGTIEHQLRNGRWIRLTDTRLSNDWVVGVRTDITDAKDSEAMRAELEASKSRLRDFADSASDWFWEMDEQLRFSTFSRRFTEVTGVPESALIGKTRQETGIPNVDPAQWQAHLDALSQHKPFRNFVHPRVKDDGEVVWLSINGRPYFDADGRFKGFRGSGSDVTEREQAKLDLIAAKEASEQAARAKSEFLANMSHEIRTPMNGVLGMLELLRDSALANEQREYVDTALSCAGDLLTLLNDVLDLSKIEAGRVEFERVEMSLHELVEGVCDLHAGPAHRKGIELVPMVEPEAPRVQGDPTRVRQVLSNLISNAIKFTERGEVTVSVAPVAAQASGESSAVHYDFEVRDTGIGIDKDVQAHIFETFTQADGSTTRRFGGTGLGLAICRYLVERMGGALQVRSEPGVGSTFFFRARFEAADGATTPASEPAWFGGRRALVVDDTAANRMVLERRLARWGVETVSAASAREALDIVAHELSRNRSFDIIILDAMMPDVDGFELARVLADDARLDGIARLMLTSLAAPETDGWRDESTGSRVLNKPIRSAQLHHCLADLWDAPSSQREPEQSFEGKSSDDGNSSEPASQPTILVVEDNIVNSKVVVGMLNRLGVCADVACDGEKALQALARQHYKLVLMDCQMPVLDGYATARAIRASDTCYHDIPIVALTASALKADAELCFEAGMSDFLSKPITKSTLATKLREWLPDASIPG